VNEEEVIQLGAEVLVYVNGAFLRPTALQQTASLSDMFSSLSLSSSPQLKFTRFVLPPTKTLSKRIQELTRITPAILEANGVSFQVVMTEWLEWITAHRTFWKSVEVALVGHNIAKFDLPLLHYQMARSKLDLATLATGAGVTHVFDSLLLAKQWRKAVSASTKQFTDALEAKTPSSPVSLGGNNAKTSGATEGIKDVSDRWPKQIDFSAYKHVAPPPVSPFKKFASNALGALYKECLNRDLSLAHDAMADVTGVIDLLIESSMVSEVLTNQRENTKLKTLESSLSHMVGEFCVPLHHCLPSFQQTQTAQSPRRS